MIRVLHVISQLGLGGAQRAALDILRHSHRYGIESRMLVLYGPGGLPEPDADGDRIRCLEGHPGLRSPSNLFRLRRELRRAVGSFQPDIIHSHLRPADMMVAASLPGCRALHVSHQQDTTASLAGSGLRPGLNRRLARRLYERMNTRFLFVSQAVERYFSDVFGRWAYESRVIHNGADERLFFMESPLRRGSGEALVFGTAARLAPEKGIDVLLEAFALLRDRLAMPIRLRIAGTGRCEGALRAQATELGISGLVEFLGQVHEMRGFYNSIDALVLPSRHSEGFPLAIVEAMMCGRPVIASDVAGASEVIVDGRNGLLVPAGEPLALMRGMERIMAEDALLRFAGQAQRDAQRLKIENTLTQVVDFYQLQLRTSRAVRQ